MYHATWRLPVVASDLKKIERKTMIRAPRSRVWRALTDVGEFCVWFHAETSETAFRPGAAVPMLSTYEGPCYRMRFTIHVVEMIPDERFSWRWHPGTNPSGEDLSGEPMTLVEFHLEDAEGGTLVTVIETGFDLLLQHRQARVFGENEGGWLAQMASLEQYLDKRK
jgi:uncharacterized protein YndB with AHSA1/START domain